MKTFGNPSVRSHRVLVAIASSVTLTALAGCGSGGGSNGGGNSGAGAITQTSSSVYAGRSYTAPTVAVGTGQTAALTVAVGSDANSIAGTMELVLAAAASAETRDTSPPTTFAVPLSGTFVAASGIFNLHGSLFHNGKSYAVTASGSLSNGSSAINVNGDTASTTLAAGVKVSGVLSKSYFPLTPNNSLVYQDTDQEGSDTPTTSTSNGFSFIGGSGTGLGASTTATINGVTVTKTATLDDSNALDGYTYYTLTNTALSYYGFDSTDSTGKIDSMTRYSPAYVLPLTLSAGQTFVQTVTDAETYVSSDTPPTTMTESLTFSESITLNDFETITVPAGTFKVAKFTVNDTTTYPKTSTSSGEVDTTSETVYLADGIGFVQDHSVSTFTTPASGSVAASTETDTDDLVLTSTTGSSGETRSVQSAKGARAGRSMSVKMGRISRLFGIL